MIFDLTRKEGKPAAPKQGEMSQANLILCSRHRNGAHRSGVAVIRRTIP